MKITIIDYGMGNIKSIIGALKYLDVKEITVSNNPSEIASADKLILPGVGSFPMAMTNIIKLNIDKYLKEAVIVNKKPIGNAISKGRTNEDVKNLSFSNLEV